MKLNTSLVSVEWLRNNLHLKSLIILDASIPKVGNSYQDSKHDAYITKSLFFDLKLAFSDVSSEFPNTLPSSQQFEIEARKLGINSDSIIVIYDNSGIYSSPRAWWLFKLMGFENVSVLDGGLPAWKQANLELQNTYSKAQDYGNFTSDFQPHLSIDFERLVKLTSDESVTIIDARSSDRFYGNEPEPRKGLRSGQIPNSINIPYTEILNGQHYLDKSTLTSIFNSKVQCRERLVFSCGSGITACILALAADISEFKNYSVYDGSWTEYTTLTNH